VSALFDAVFAVFVASMVVIAVLAVRWGVHRDRAERRRRLDPGDDARASAPGPPGLPAR
jgi:hypothetical protein